MTTEDTWLWTGVVGQVLSLPRPLPHCIVRTIHCSPFLFLLILPTCQLQKWSADGVIEV